MTTYPISIDSAGGEYMESVVVLVWSAKPGEPVKAGEVLVTVETAKAATELEATHDGWLAEVLFSEGQEAPVGAVLGTISDVKPANENPAAETNADPKLDSEPAFPVSRTVVSAASPSSHVPSRDRPVASPLARRLAEMEEVDLASITGSGPGGRIKKRDIDAAVERRASQQALARPELGRQEMRAPSMSFNQAAPIVLVHGFGADRSIWRQVIPLLPAGCEVIALDLPGHGSEAARTAASLEEIALHLSDRLEERGVDAAHLVGHSLGGAAVLALCELGRVSVRSVTLLAPGGLGPEINGSFVRGIASATTVPGLESWLAAMVGDRTCLPKGYAQAALRQMERAGNRDGLVAMAATLFPDDTQSFLLVDALTRLTVPTRLLWGRLDRVIPPTHATHVPGAVSVHLLEGVGHTPHLEAPALTGRLIGETVRSAG